MLENVSFTINGKIYDVSSSSVPIDTTLNRFITINAGLTGTKSMCLEGGCGACIVAVKAKHPVDNKIRTWAVNSCLTPVFSCHGYDITTIEGLGGRNDGYHEIQNRLAKFNGSQCGYCSPGMVMNMYSLIHAKDGNITMADVEKSFDGNVCRCTGYRSILDAFKSLANDGSQTLLERCADIEDLGKICAQSRQSSGWSRYGEDAKELDDSQPIRMKFFDEMEREWYKVVSLSELFECLNDERIDGKEYQLAAGNTGNGVYGRNTDVQVFIDINDVVELRSHLITDDNLVMGGGVTLTESINILIKTARMDGFAYLKNIAKHIELIGNIAIRNVGTLAGNLMVKQQNIEYCSDLFILLESIGSVLYITSSDNEDDLEETTLSDFLDYEMEKKIILNILLPILDNNAYAFRSYKIACRAQNAQAYLIAGFLIETKDDVVRSARLCFGGIDPSFIHATATEEFLIDKNLYSNEILSEALNMLTNELNPDQNPANASPEYRKNLAVALFFKFVMSTKIGVDANEYELQRGLSSGTQDIWTVREKWPLTKCIPNIDGLIQAAGEAQFISDLPAFPNQLWAAFVPATIANGRLVNIDAGEALKIPGVHCFFSAKDIPGKNSFTPLVMPTICADEEIFVNHRGKIAFNGQPCGVILAESFDLANYAATKVNVAYSEKNKGAILTSLRDAFEAKSNRLFIPAPMSKEASDYGANTTRKINGQFDIGAQSHFTSEPQTTICVPTEHGLDVYAATQWINFTKVAISEALNIPNHNIRMMQKRVGGGYGAKFTRASQIACACAVASHLTNRTVRFVMSLESNMSVVGKRHPCHIDYEAEINDDGRIQRLKIAATHDLGTSANDSPQQQFLRSLSNCYIGDAFDLEMKAVLTNLPANTFAMAAGTAEAIATIENVMEHIAWDAQMDPIDVRMVNMAAESAMRVMLPDFLTECHFYKRREEIEEFNQISRWLKRGIAVVPVEYRQDNLGSVTVYVSVHHLDGSVSISHDCVEVGQGINTKVAQMAAHIFGIGLDDVKVHELDQVHGGNSFEMAGVITAESVCLAVQKACNEIHKRMAQIRSELSTNDWKEVALKCFAQNVNLTAMGTYVPSELEPYIVWGVTCAEVEVDILTGNLLLKRVDILEDIGESMSPGIDIAQIESAFVMGIGYWLHESIIYDRKTGELLTNSTLTYQPPGFQDIPVDFRIKLAKNSANDGGDGGRSRATGEPAFCMSVVAIFAIRHAIESARRDAGISEWFNLGAPSTPEQIFLHSGNSIAEYKLK